MACLSTSHIYSTSVTTTTITVTWNAVVTASSYQVEYQVKPAYPDPLGSWTQLTEQTTPGATITGLTTGTAYLIRVNCICDTGNCYSVTIEVPTA
jgi:hypothetical protein